LVAEGFNHTPKFTPPRAFLLVFRQLLTGSVFSLEPVQVLKMFYELVDEIVEAMSIRKPKSV
jgi:hypothetical protein